MNSFNGLVYMSISAAAYETRTYKAYRIRSGRGWLGIVPVTVAARQAKPVRRSRIKAFSSKSARNMMRYLRDSIPRYRVMITLTYPRQYETDGRIFKRHLHIFLQWARRQAGNNPKFSAFWFMEFQKRGAPHFHIFSTNRIDKTKAAMKWANIVRSSEIEKHVKAGTRVETIRGGKRGYMKYARKYAAKMDQKVVPNGIKNCGRFWGVYGDSSRLEAAISVTRQQLKSPNVRDACMSLVRMMSSALRLAVPIKRWKKEGFKGKAYVWDNEDEVTNMLVTMICKRIAAEVEEERQCRLSADT